MTLPEFYAYAAPLGKTLRCPEAKLPRYATKVICPPHGIGIGDQDGCQARVHTNTSKLLHIHWTLFLCLSEHRAVAQQLARQLFLHSYTLTHMFENAVASKIELSVFRIQEWYIIITSSTCNEPHETGGDVDRVLVCCSTLIQTFLYASLIDGLYLI